ncbi:flavin-containing monooxygenase [Litorimonas sp. RW-G-Af-16]|uniref:flavin-containing monooxygenase n=1 Tax=Litorimonas sp. RW-G-Af-16 TaxID=3241168 RepID=UPI00390C5D62
MSEIFDMVVIGAGLSGVGAACRYRTALPDGKLAVIEARDAIGGTWDLFRYPGIRSDSDMLTLGYDFRPWVGDDFLADGPSIRQYVRDTADEFGVTEMIQFNSKVMAADFDSQTNLWTLQIETDGERRELRTRFITSCAGYYSYAEGYTPEFAGRDDFKGQIVHPQQWPDDLDYANKRVVVIGSGATAVTLVPKLAESAAHVTMLQRSPSYVASLPSKDYVGKILNTLLPAKLAFKLNRAKNIKISRMMYDRAQKDPQKARDWFRKKTLKALGKDYPVDTHFNPSYNPWDQRVCMIPDADLFEAIKDGRASVVTDHIERFTDAGISLVSGTKLDADIIVTATGLNVVFVGDINASVDGEAIDIANTFGYKGMMFSDVPNFISVFGYTNASWTLRADLISRFMVRLLSHMKQTGAARVTPIAPVDMEQRPWVDFQAGYLMRVMDKLPKQGDRMPWLNVQDYKHDQVSFMQDPIDDGALVFESAKVSEAAE